MQPQQIGEDDRQCEIIEPLKDIPKILFEQLTTMKIKDKSTEINRQRATLKIALGNLFVCGYRIFKRFSQHECLILFKKNGFETKYGYFKVMRSYADQFPKKFINQINFCIKEINRMKRSESHSFCIFLCFTEEKSCIEICDGAKFMSLIKPYNAPENKYQLLEMLSPNDSITNSFVPNNPQRERELQHDSFEQFSKLKDILYHYIDTFGQKYKTNYYVDLQKKCMTSFRIGYLINTINYLIFQQTGIIAKSGQLMPTYSQIQSSCWTVFMKKKDGMKGDRKDIVLTGGGRILIIDLIFLTKLNKYINQEYRQQVRLLLDQHKNSYSQGQAKVMKIDNTINFTDSFGLIYNYQIKNVGNFSKVNLV